MSSSRVGNPFTFTGRELDPETGLMHYRARTYDPAQGRFKQRDPLGYVDGMGLYGFGASRPTRSVDPFGSAVTAIDPCCSEDQKQKILSADATLTKNWGSLTLGIELRDLPWALGEAKRWRWRAPVAASEINAARASWQRLRRSIEDLRTGLTKGYTASCNCDEDPMRGAYAYTKHNVARIRFCPRFFAEGDTQRVKTLLHELTHIVLRTIDPASGEAIPVDIEQWFLWAESWEDFVAATETGPAVSDAALDNAMRQFWRLALQAPRFRWSAGGGGNMPVF
jgi:RHS repeat-associated protein